MTPAYEKIIQYEPQSNGTLRVQWEDRWGYRHWRDATDYEQFAYELPPGLEVVGLGKALYGKEKSPTYYTPSPHTWQDTLYPDRNAQEEF
jgi:hypothetical protein